MFFNQNPTTVLIKKTLIDHLYIEKINKAFHLNYLFKNSTNKLTKLMVICVCLGLQLQFQ